MSYATRVSGEFQFSPPASWGEIRGSGFAAHQGKKTPDGESIFRHPGLNIQLLVNEQVTETEFGQESKMTASRVEMIEIDQYRERNLVDQVQNLVAMFPDRQWLGEFICDGEDSGDFWRIYIDNAQAVREDAAMFFPSDLRPKILPILGNRNTDSVMEVIQESSRYHKSYPWGP